MFLNPFGLDARRQRLVRKAPPGPLRDFLSTPFPPPGRPVAETPLLAVDFETTGLDPRKAHLLSVGCVAIDRARIELSTACHRLVRSTRKLEENNVAVHQLTDDQVSAGEPLEQVIAELLGRLAGRVLLAHHAVVEAGFLKTACRRLYGMTPLFPVIDTLRLARRRLERRNQPYQEGELRLFNLRERYGLPRYRAHNALCDAIATAELFLVQAGEGGGRRPPPLKNFLVRT